MNFVITSNFINFKVNENKVQKVRSVAAGRAREGGRPGQHFAGGGGI